MKILDCTLRDGGFRTDFNWDLKFANRYYNLLSNFNIPYIELGYWKQKSKSINPFYNLGLKEVEIITKSSTKHNATIIIDYHYCDKDVNIYPKKNQTPISMIRITSRKENIDEAISFADKLASFTNLDLSFQIINSTNYSKKELENTVKKLSKSNFLYIYFADSHGNLHLPIDYWKFEDSIFCIRENNKKVGFHLHNHTNRALLNYYFCLEKKIEIVDSTILGMGKGAGNLKLEEIIRNENFIELLYFIKKESKHFKLNETDFLYNSISGRLNITDNYAKQAMENKVDLYDFYEICSGIRGKQKDTFDKKIFKLNKDLS